MREKWKLKGKILVLWLIVAMMLGVTPLGTGIYNLLGLSMEVSADTEDKVVLLDNGVLQLYGNFSATDCRAYSGDTRVQTIRAMEGCVLPADCMWLFDGMMAHTIDLSKADSSNVYDMMYMFKNCQNLKNLNLTGIDTSKVHSFDGMFWNCHELENLDISGFDTSNAEDMGNMFRWCEKLTYLDLRGFDTSEVTDMGYMFAGCQSLRTINMSSFNVSNVGLSNYMFYGCIALTTIYVSPDWATFDGIYSSENMFLECTHLVAGNTVYDPNHVDGSYSYISSAGRPGYMVASQVPVFSKNLNEYYDYDPLAENATVVLSITAADAESYLWCVYDENGKHRFREAIDLGWFKAISLPIGTTRSVIISDISEEMKDKKIALCATNSWGTAVSRKTKIDFIETGSCYQYHAASRVLTLRGNVTASAISPYKYKTDKVIAEEGCVLPQSCKLLFDNFEASEIDLSKADSSNVTNTSDMFYHCTGLTTLNLSGFDTSHVTDMSYMFTSCEKLTSLDLSNFDTSNVTNMEGVFAHCLSLKSLNVTTFDTSKVYFMRNMFINCKSLEYVDVTSFDVSKVTNMSYMFKGCTNLKMLDLSSFHTEKLQLTTEMFCADEKLKEIYVSYLWNLSKVSKSEDMFQGCTSLVGQNGTTYNADYVDKTYARIDASGAPGYFRTGSVPVNRFTFDLEGFETLENMYVEASLRGRDVKAFQVLTPEGAPYSGTLCVYYGDNEIRNTEALRCGMTLKFQIQIHLDDSVTFATSFSGTIHGMEAQVDWPSERIAYLTISYKIPIPENGIKVANISREVAEPVIGEAPPTDLVPLPATYSGFIHYTVESVNWLPQTSTFQAGQTYYLIVEYKAYPNYGFYPENEFFINGKQATVDTLTTGRGGRAVISCKFTLPSLPEITKQPVDWYGEYGKKASFSVEAEGEELTYCWQYKKSGEWIPYQITTYDTPNFKVTMNEKNVKWPLRCLITDKYGNEITTNEVWMKLLSEKPEPIKITKQPEDWYGQYGKKASFSVEATGTGLTYQWQYKKSGNWIDYAITTADTPNFKVTMNEKNVKWPIRCLLRDVEGNELTTTEVWMKLLEEEPQPEVTLAITVQPVDWYGQYGKKAAFDLEAIGEGLTYQWQYKKGTADWVNYEIATADTPNFRVTMNEKNVKWAYRCVVRDSKGNTVISNEVHMYVKGAMPVAEGPQIITQPTDWYGRIGKKASFHVEATGNGLTYQWQCCKKGMTWVNYDIVTADTDTLQVSSNDKTINWRFRCVITDVDGRSVTTNEVHMIVVE